VRSLPSEPMGIVNAAVREQVQDAVNKQLSPSIQFQIEEGLGTIAHADARQSHGMSQIEHIGPTIESAVRDSL
jgi:hypothetical protein